MELKWIITVIIVLLILYYANRTRGYFDRRGIKSIPFAFPIVGNCSDIFTTKKHFQHMISRLYNAFPDQNYVGHMQFTFPVLMLRDLDAIKQVTIKDFDHFLDHIGGIDENQDPLFGSNLFSLKGEKWKDMRATLSPAFTSSKMRNMFQFVEEIAKQTTEFYLNEMKSPENNERGLLEIEMKDGFTRYTNDVIATSAFGIKVNSLSEKDNEFYKVAKKTTNFNGMFLIKFFISAALPALTKMLGITLFSESTSNFFRHLVLNTMKTREENHIVRNDMIQLLMEARKGSLKHDTNNIDDQDAGFATVDESNVGKQTTKRKWTDDDLVAQVILFLIGGFDTASNLLCFMAHELAINPEIQKNLQNEIDDIVNEKGYSLDYNDLPRMKYMDMVVSETLRLWPPLISLDRRCIKKYTLPPISSSSSYRYTLQPDEFIWIPVYSIHHDPKYYENPDLFDPERFSDERKHKINPMAYLPFGSGPRNCIGSRFALMEAKAIMFHLLAKFDFVETAKTQNPIKLCPNTFNMWVENGFWVGLKPRNI